MASYSRVLLRMLPLRRWRLAGLGPVWLSEPQPACRLLWPSSPSFVDRVMGDVERQFQEMEKMSRAFFQAAPLATWERGGREEASEESARPAGEDGRPEGQYRFSVDVAGFAPEEMTVNLEGRKVTVTAQRHRQSEGSGGGGGSWVERQELRRETLLPPDVDLQAVTCSLAPDGQLCIEAPRLASSASAQKAIPIDVKPAADASLGGEEKPKDP
ncbi:heat shock protein 30C-like [Python bivittatus]|uniref:Heat shock protein 30C-like n=1 Tax=Python bivittatus TaxID=176946 RepID=A0A9F2RCM6_PYTBI|nr:heat shock protein 30C-like [Python bivittatus]